MKSNLIVLAILVAMAYSATFTVVTVYNTADEQSGTSPGGTACSHLDQYDRVGQSRGPTYLGFPIGNLTSTTNATFYLKGVHCVNADKLNFSISSLEDPAQNFTEMNSTSQCQNFTTGNTTWFTVDNDTLCTSEGVNVTDALNDALEAGNDQLVLILFDTVMEDQVNFCNRITSPSQEPHYNDNYNCGLLANGRDISPSSFYIVVTQSSEGGSTQVQESSASPSQESTQVQESSASPSQGSTQVQESSASPSSESGTPQSTSGSEEPPYSCQPPCHNESCCACLQIPNPSTGTGYLEYQEECLDGGLHCVDNSGCLLCYRPVDGGHNFGNRPTCDRFGGTYDPSSNCSDDACCIDVQGNNENDGNGYLEFFDGCANNTLGTLDCVQDHVGCRLCYKPVNGGTNVGNRPVCMRYKSQGNLDAINKFEKDNGDLIQGNVAGTGSSLTCLFMLIAFMLYFN